MERVFKDEAPAIFSAQLHKYLIPCKTADGAYRIQHTIIKPLKLDDGETLAVMSIQDVTDETKRIESIKEMRDKILGELDQRILAEEMLKKLNADKDKFFSIIAHDIKNPFASILGFAEILKNENDTLSRKEIKEYSDHLYDASKNLYTLLENLLDWSRLHTGRIKFIPKAFQLNSLISERIPIYIDSAKKKEISLELKETENLTVFADSNMIDTIIRNLVSNALKYTPRRGIITIEIYQENSFAVLNVTDTGIGMDSAQIDKLFKIDQSCSTDGTEQERGTGLGLLLCSEMIEYNKGKIRVTSEKGKGSSFEVLIPLLVETIVKE